MDAFFSKLLDAGSGRTMTDEAMHAAFESFHGELRGPVLLRGVASAQAPQGLAG